MRDARQLYRMADGVSTWTERASDRLVGLVSEKARLRRAHHRLLARHEDYAAAGRLVHESRSLRKSGNPGSRSNETPWLSLSDRDADSDQIPLLSTRRARSRWIEGRDGIGAGIFHTRQRKVIGSGLRLQARAVRTVRGEGDKPETEADDIKNSAFEAVWNERKDRLYPAEGMLCQGAAQRMIFQRSDVDGDILVVPTVTSAREPLWFELVEGDRLTTPADVRTDSRLKAGHSVMEGVEKDEHGRVVAYWVSKRHPGESFLGMHAKGKQVLPVSRSSKDYVRVEFERAKLRRSKVSRPGQSRGLPLLHAAEQDIHDIDLLLLSTLKRAQVAAAITLFITTEASIEDFFPAGDQTDEEPWGYEVNQTLRPGEFFRLAPGEKVETTGKVPVAPDLDAFLWLYARRIGASVGMSPQAVMGERTDANYSGARSIELEDRVVYDLERCEFATDLLDWQVRMVWADAIQRGDRRLAGYSVEDAMTIPLQWIGDARHWVDPLKEVQSIKEALALNLTTLQDEATALGKDWEALLRQRARERDLVRELGLEAEDEGASALAGRLAA